ncbi:integrating conjugative element protein [Escherichia sp. E4742]|uniref:integrating conjugative element protein n=1 Tax=Escherichia sp. E4742 TaxID=2044467 RepID=UPI0010FD3312|nr:integrating conjugative element protein [Escherichia sp. E4742]QCT87988.1 integrating conjugative element protein [Escherichia sp. E4742]TLJ07218.1 integrating conjugative element protein [Escherichia sp. E4742]
MNKHFILSGILLANITLSTPVQAVFDLDNEFINQDNSKGIKGAVNDNLFYTIGGGTVISQPPSNNNMEKISMGINWDSDFMCGNFDVTTTVKNQLNGVTNGFKDMMGTVITGATGAVASLPAMVLQRANPGLYELLSNGILQATVAFDKAQLNCQNMATKMTDFAYSSKWTQASIGEEFKKIVSITPDAVAADNQLKTTTGKEGVKWIGGQKRGGSGQKAIRPTHDMAKAGFNILNKQPVTSSGGVSGSACNGSLCKKYKTSDEAAEAVVKVLGDRAIRTCTEASECSSGGVENEAGASTAGVGFSPMLEETTKENTETLAKLVNGNLAPNASNLAKLKSGDLTVTRGVIQALKDDPDNAALVQRLASELAMADTISTALGMRRMLMAGQAEPNAADQTMALTESDRRLEFLDREVQALKNEMEIRKAISNNTLLVALSRQESREADNGLRQSAHQNDDAIQNLNKKVEE